MRRFAVPPSGDGLDALARALARPESVVVSVPTVRDGTRPALFLAHRRAAGLVPVVVIAGPPREDDGPEEVAPA